MNTAIIYYSMSGNTEYVARKVSEKINADLIKLIPKKEYPNKGLKKFLWCGKSAIMKDVPELEDYTFDSKKYDKIVFMTPVWASNFTPPLRTFIKDNLNDIKDKKISAAVCFSGGGAEEAIQKLKNELGINKFDAELVLIDPKDRETIENDKKIEDFCNLLCK